MTNCYYQQRHQRQASRSSRREVGIGKDIQLPVFEKVMSFIKKLSLQVCLHQNLDLLPRTFWINLYEESWWNLFVSCERHCCTGFHFQHQRKIQLTLNFKRVNLYIRVCYSLFFKCGNHLCLFPRRFYWFPLRYKIFARASSHSSYILKLWYQYPYGWKK